jgi:hypothetical protein
MFTRYCLSIIDGVLCVRCTLANYSQPIVAHLHWPAREKAADVARTLGLPDSTGLVTVDVTGGHDGCYTAYSQPDQFGSRYMALIHTVDGARTQPILTEEHRIVVKSTRRNPVTYRNGFFFKAMAAGETRLPWTEFVDSYGSLLPWPWFKFLKK